MDKYVLIKQSFYTNYDIIRFDILTLNRVINELRNIDDRDYNELVNLLDKLYSAILDKKIKEIVLIMKSLVINEKNYNSIKILSSLEVIKKSILKKEKLYKKYVNYIDNLQEYL